MIKTIVIDESRSFYIPNSFSPNGDDINDIFQPKGNGVRSFHMEIFDRWGEKLFSSTDFTKGWDGTFKGETCKSDSYVWKIGFTNSNGKVENRTGYVNLIY